MAEKSEQLAAVKSCFLLKKTVVMLLTAYRESVLGKKQAYEWFSHFRNGE
jgi:hypothetical protein